MSFRMSMVHIHPPAAGEPSRQWIGGQGLPICAERVSHLKIIWHGAVIIPVRMTIHSEDMPKEVATDLRCSKSQVYRLMSGDVDGLTVPALRVRQTCASAVRHRQPGRTKTGLCDLQSHGQHALQAHPCCVPSFPQPSSCYHSSEPADVLYKIQSGLESHWLMLLC